MTEYEKCLSRHEISISEREKPAAQRVVAYYSCLLIHLEDEELHILLQKAKKGEVWDCVFVGHSKINPLDQQEIQKKLMLERF